MEETREDRLKRIGFEAGFEKAKDFAYPGIIQPIIYYTFGMVLAVIPGSMLANSLGVEGRWPTVGMIFLVGMVIGQWFTIGIGRKGVRWLLEAMVDQGKAPKRRSDA